MCTSTPFLQNAWICSDLRYCFLLDVLEKKYESSWNAGICCVIAQQLKKNLEEIKYKYSCYIDTLVKKLQSIPGVDVEELHGFVNKNVIFHSNESDEQRRAREKLRSADTIGKILHYVSDYYPFWEFGLFERIIVRWEIKKDCDDLKYAEHFKKYASMHKISEFMESYPALKKKYVASNEIAIKFDISKFECIQKVLDYKASLEKILSIKEGSLKLIDVKKGCVVVTYVLPTDITKQMFTKEEWFTANQKERLKDLSIIWLQYEDKRIYFKRIIIKKESGMHFLLILFRSIVVYGRSFL